MLFQAASAMPSTVLPHRRKPLLPQSHFAVKIVGKKLMAALMDFVHSQGIKRVVLSTVQELAAARALYAQFGFRPVRETSNAQWKDKPIIEEDWLWEQ